MIAARVGPYRLISELGSGGTGTVYRAVVDGKCDFGLEAGTPVALKFVHPHLARNAIFMRRFRREGDIGKTICHPNVVRVYGAALLENDSSELNALVMEYVKGQTLRALLVELGRVPEELCRHVGRELAKGLEAIHTAGVIHRDLKPENVLITPDHVVKVMDLGFGRLLDDTTGLSQSGTFVGSVRYAAPEQFAAERDLDPRLDLYALGLVLYEIATGEHPYPTDDLLQFIGLVQNVAPRRAGERNPQLSPFLEEVVHQLLAKDRESRFASATALLAVLSAGERSPWWQARERSLWADTRHRPRRVRIPRETAVYGRDLELARLRGLYEEVKSGAGQVVLLEGEAGIGKTRVVDEFVGRLLAEGEELNFLIGSNAPGGAATPAGAFTTAFREHFGEHADEALQDYLSSTPLLIPGFAALLRGDSAEEHAVPLTQESLRTAFVGTARGLAKERPTILLVDDLHFAPNEGLAHFMALALAIPGHRMLLVGTARPELPQQWKADLNRLPHATRIGFERLAIEGVTRLLADALKSELVDEDLIEQIGLRSDGNPFFVFEILRSLREGRVLTQKPDGTWVRAGDPSEIHIPDSVAELVQARIASLDPEDRELLEVASCCGFQFDPVLVGESVGVAKIPLLKRLARIERSHRAVHAAGVSYVFDHHEFYAKLYGGLSEVLRREYHAAIAEVLERRLGALDCDPQELEGGAAVAVCGHFLKGARGERALRYLDAALDHLERSHLPAAAVELAGSALAVEGLLTDRGRIMVLCRRAEKLEQLGRLHEEGIALREAFQLCGTTGDRDLRIQVMRSLGWHLDMVGQYAESRRLLEEAIELAEAIGDSKLEASVSCILGNVHWKHGDYVEAQRRHERDLTLQQLVGNRTWEASASGNLGLVLYNLGQYSEARAMHERQLALSRELGDRSMESKAAGNLGITLCDLGLPEEALALLRLQHTRTREMGDRQQEVIATGNLGRTLLTLGRFTEAKTYIERAVTLARETGQRRSEAIATGNLGVLCFDIGRLAEAKDHLDQQLRLAEEINDRWGKAVAFLNRAPLHALLGDLVAAREACEAARAIGSEIGSRQVVSFAWQSLGELAEQAGETDVAMRCYRTAMTERRDLGDRQGLATTLAHFGGLLRLIDGNMEEARQHLEEAMEIAAEIDVGDAAVLAALHLALLLGDPASAESTFSSYAARLSLPFHMRARFLLWQVTGTRRHLEKSYQLLSELSNHAPNESRESMMRGVTLHRAIEAAWSAM